MKLSSNSFDDGARIPGEFAFGLPADEGHVTLGPNRNPHLSWSDVPPGTKSFAVTCHDPDVPSRPDDVNQEGRTVPKDLPRVDFFHWVLIDVPASVTEIAAATHSDGVTPRGKDAGPAPAGVQGLNDYTKWFEGDSAMEGKYAGYDGPCPPWNDELVHRYVFTVHALDVESLGLSGPFNGEDARKAIEDHVLGKAAWTGTYSLNPQVA